MNNDLWTRKWGNLSEITPEELEKLCNKINEIGCMSFKFNNSEIFSKRKEIEMSETNSQSIEMVNHPLHYGGADNPYEAIKVIEAWEADFNIGTALRYLCRCGKKTIGGSSEAMRLEDIKKAIWYLNREAENIEKNIDKSDNPYQD